MKKSLQYNFCVLVLVLCGYLPVSAQQDPLFTQYMFNGIALNPAYAGSHESVSISALYRNHWTGWNDGAGDTQTFSIHSPLNDNHVGLGLTVMRDKLWVTERLDVLSNFAYRIHLGKGKLSFGLQLGARKFSLDLSKLQDVAKDLDPLLSDVNSTVFNFGTGVYYYSNKFFIGFSVPQLVRNKFDSDDLSVKEDRHYFLSAGYVLGNWGSVKFKPSVLIKAVEGAPISYDINAHFLFLNDILWLGASWRSYNSLNWMAEIIIPKTNLRAGFSFDHDFNNTTRGLHGSSVEILLNYRFKLNKDVPLTPRYF
ncbi:type IX secretion system membrane protein PorP/SprF [Fulvivirgaceae bacterium BMA10]|uniref:Type IX secretion system membrane protein PorP/SprF n=1 Tax=Splendidivirga corallicola TaxID=3051826 RepID=A0ABT8KVG7_9BACT|nr:type IX secretion system membrane protein PorP/SprF [Fulvivirgaceae bacterium BMA10]